MLGIVAALEMERRWLVPAGEGDGPLVEQAGPGSLRARTAAERLLEGGATALASWGVAAGLDPRLGAGAVVLPRRVVVSTGESYPSEAAWHRVLYARLDGELEVAAGDLADAPGLLETPAAKARLRDRLGACAADMESAAVASVAAAATVPFMALRVVLDGACMTLPPLLGTAVDDSGRLRAAWLLRHVIGRPGTWGRLARLASSRAAAGRAMRRMWTLTAPDLLLGAREGRGRRTRGSVRPVWRRAER